MSGGSWTGAPLAVAALLLSGEAGAQVLLEDALCDACEVALESVATLGEFDGPAALESEFNVVRVDSKGRFIVFFPGSSHFWVFRPDGSLVDRVGREGEGPGEFMHISGLLVDPTDSLFVFDPSQGRVSVIAPDLEFVRSFRVEHALGGKGVHAGDRMIINAGIFSPDRVGLPLHVMDRDGHLEMSFGSAIAGAYRPDLREVVESREIALTSNGSVWSARLNEYVIERWDSSGSLASTLKREVAWFPSWWVPTQGADMVPVTLMEAIQVRGDSLWILAKAAGPEWRSAVEPRGRLFRVIDPDRYRNSVVELIDVRQGTVVASSRLEYNLDGFLGRDLVFRNTSGPGGAPVVLVERLLVRKPLDGNE